jgi:hypothetical protein
MYEAMIEYGNETRIKQKLYVPGRRIVAVNGLDVSYDRLDNHWVSIIGSSARKQKGVTSF